MTVKNAKRIDGIPMHSKLTRTVLTLAMLSGAYARPSAAAPAAPANSEAMTFARKMGIGWNLGNTLDATGDWIKGKSVSDYETAWGNPVTTQAMFDGVKAAGFNTVRIPVAWSNLMGPNYAINPALMARVDEVANYGLKDGVYVIIDIHWDGGWITKFPENYGESMKRYRSMWSQIAGHFKNASDHLIFESLNEESDFHTLWNTYGGQPDHKDQAYALLNSINQAFTDVVRGSGGNNATRYLLIAGYTTNIGYTVDPDFQMPYDPVAHSMVSVHYYEPATFAILDKDASWGKMAYTWGTSDDVAALQASMLRLKPRFLDQGIPVVIGEYGAPGNKDPASTVKYLSTICQTAYSLGCVPVLWDAGGCYDRKALKWKDPQIGEALGRVAAQWRQDNPA